MLFWPTLTETSSILLLSGFLNSISIFPYKPEIPLWLSKSLFGIILNSRNTLCKVVKEFGTSLKSKLNPGVVADCTRVSVVPLWETLILKKFASG